MRGARGQKKSGYGVPTHAKLVRVRQDTNHEQDPDFLAKKLHFRSSGPTKSSLTIFRKVPLLLGISQIRAKIKMKIWNSGHVWGDERARYSFPISILVARGDDEAPNYGEISKKGSFRTATKLVFKPKKVLY